MQVAQYINQQNSIANRSTHINLDATAEFASEPQAPRQNNSSQEVNGSKNFKKIFLKKMIQANKDQT